MSKIHGNKKIRLLRSPVYVFRFISNLSLYLLIFSIPIAILDSIFEFSGNYFLLKIFQLLLLVSTVLTAIMTYFFINTVEISVKKIESIIINKYRAKDKLRITGHKMKLKNDSKDYYFDRSWFDIFEFEQHKDKIKDSNTTPFPLCGPVIFKVDFFHFWELLAP